MRRRCRKFLRKWIWAGSSEGSSDWPKAKFARGTLYGSRKCRERQVFNKERCDSEGRTACISLGLQQFWPLRPERPIQSSILDSFGDMLWDNRGSSFEVRNCPGNFKDTIRVSLTQTTNKRTLETFKKACASYHQRANALTLEIRNLDRFPEDRKRQLLAGASALLQEGKNLRTIASSWVYPRPMGLTILEYVLTYEQCKIISGKRRCESLLRIVSRIECDTFYWDLLIWFVLPGGRCEELLGDLNEEYLLRISNDGEASARAWYRHQATMV